MSADESSAAVSDDLSRDADLSLSDRFEILDTRWETSQGACHLARDRRIGPSGDGLARQPTERVVLEIFDRAAWDESGAAGNLWRLMDAPGTMPPVLTVHADDKDKKVYIVSALPLGERLAESTEVSTLPQAWSAAEAIAAAVERLHGLGLVHGALPPAVVLVGPDAVQLLGPGTVAFHSAGRGGGEPLGKSLGHLASPEAARDAPDAAADIFAIGRLIKDLFAHDGPARIPPRLTGLINRLTQPDPIQRVAASALLGTELQRLRQSSSSTLMVAGLAGLSIGAMLLLAGVMVNWAAGRANDVAARITETVPGRSHHSLSLSSSGASASRPPAPASTDTMTAGDPAAISAATPALPDVYPSVDGSALLPFAGADGVLDARAFLIGALNRKEAAAVPLTPARERIREPLGEHLDDEEANQNETVGPKSQEKSVAQ